MVLVNPEDPRNTKSPHAGGIENPTNEYGLPLDQAVTKYDFQKNIPKDLGSDYAPVTPEEQAEARQRVIDAKRNRAPVSWGKRIAIIGAAAVTFVGVGFGIKAAKSGGGEIVPTGTQPTGTAPANPGTVAPTSAIESGATSTSIEVTPTAPAGPEVTHNPDGTDSFTVGQFEGHPKELGAAFVEQGLQDWSNAGANLHNLKVAVESNQGVDAIPNAAKRIATENKTLFADSLFAAGWETNPRSVAMVNQQAIDNEATVGRVLLTGSEKTLPNPEGLSGPAVEEAYGNHGRPVYHNVLKVTDVTVVSQSSTELVLTVNYTQTGNEEETRLNDLGYKQTRGTGIITLTLVKVTGADGIDFKISDVMVPKGSAGDPGASTSTSHYPGE